MSTKIRKQFEFSKFKQRHVALKLLYFGWDYDGLVEQANSPNTIEYHLINALIKACLIESRQKSRFNRCGRTDKGVSSFGQVVDLNIRSNLVDESDHQNVGLFTPHNYTGSGNSQSNVDEINYVDILNRLLPDHIKVIAWAPASKTFSSRFSCKSRSYSYIFPKGDLCIVSMETAIKYLIGQHDFRNLCSYDLKNGVVNHVRTILATSIKPLTVSPCQDALSSRTDNQYSYYEIVIVGQAFLYHQIRCIMTILFLVGRKQEPPELVRDLLDLNKCPARPKYCRASSLPLSLFDCRYEPGDLPLGWVYDQGTLFNVYRQLKQLWLGYKTKALMIERVLLDVESSFKPTDDQHDKLNLTSWKDFGLEHDNMSDTKYIPMLKRPREESLEAKIEQIKAKKRLKTTRESSDDDNDNDE